MRLRQGMAGIAGLIACRITSPTLVDQFLQKTGADGYSRSLRRLTWLDGELRGEDPLVEHPLTQILPTLVATKPVTKDVIRPAPLVDRGYDIGTNEIRCARDDDHLCRQPSFRYDAGRRLVRNEIDRHHPPAGGLHRIRAYDFIEGIVGALDQDIGEECGN